MKRRRLLDNVSLTCPIFSWYVGTSTKDLAAENSTYLSVYLLHEGCWYVGASVCLQICRVGRRICCDVDFFFRRYVLVILLFYQSDTHLLGFNNRVVFHSMENINSFGA